VSRFDDLSDPQIVFIYHALRFWAEHHELTPAKQELIEEVKSQRSTRPGARWPLDAEHQDQRWRRFSDDDLIEVSCLVRAVEESYDLSPRAQALSEALDEEMSVRQLESE
jgi:hypothetical protein